MIEDAPEPAVEGCKKHFLDTNAYHLLLSGAPHDAYTRLRAKIARETWVEAAISEITSLEIHSVIGKLSRGRAGGLHPCNREIVRDGERTPCTQQWRQDAARGLRPLEVARLRKAVRDAEHGVGPIRVTVVPLTPADFIRGKDALYRFGSTHTFGSHDAVIAAAAAAYEGGSARIVTSDRGLKSALKLMGISYYDPLKDEQWEQPLICEAR
jgi:hypothetical protein